ncbi:MAG TPA: aquaporin [Longimicrobiales bacterium]|nr:aquaporin [Longimicrobiales bacterium]
MRQYLTEFLGTFFLVLTIGLVVAAGTPMGPLAIGSVLMVMVYMGGHVSGAHYNPAVTLAVWLRGGIETRWIGGYWGVQLLGGLAAAAVSAAVTGSTFAPAPAPGASPLGALLLEFLFAFALSLVVLNTATADETAGNSYFGLAIGFTLLVGVIAAGPVSGGAFNPAVGLGPIGWQALTDGGGFSNAWLYLAGPLSGGAVAAAVFKVQHPST